MTTTSKEISQVSMLKDSPRIGAYIFKPDVLEDNIKDLKDTMSNWYSNFRIGYSYKTNYFSEICRIADKNDCMAEVVSYYEYMYAKHLGILNRNIIFNGVIPSPECKYDCAVRGGIVNVDNIGEYRAVSDIANQRRHRIRIGVRVNFDIGNGLVSRFGVDIHGTEFEHLMEEISNDMYVTLEGFHCHIGSSRQLEYWKTKVDKMIELAKQYNVQYIDLGGGMFGKMPKELSEQFNGYPEVFNDYAGIIGIKMKEAFPDQEVMLILEPGTALVGNAFDVEAHVTCIKTVRGVTFVTLDCYGESLGFICECKDIPIEVIHTGVKPQITVSNAVIAGNTCLEGDIIKKEYSGNIAVGDTVIIKNVGAYSLSCSRQFISPRMGVKLPDGRYIKESETYEDMYRAFSKQDC